MSRTVLTLVVRRQVGRARSVSRLMLGLAIALNASSCLDEVYVPPCVVYGTCANSGAGGQIAEGGGPAGEEHPSGAPSQPAGRGGANSSSEGGSDSGTGGAEGGAEAGADAGGAPGAGGEGGAGDVLPACESCVVRPATLDAPCVGRDYQATLAIAGGEPPFSWQLGSGLDGWSLTASPDEPRQAVLQNTQVAGGEIELTVNVTDANGEHVSRTYALTPRTSCWFAYTAKTEQGSELRLVDPLASPADSIALAHNTGVFDFAFSPDGKYLAYSYGKSEASPRGQHLALVDLETLEDKALSFGEDSISAFAWSPDSATLAAGFVANGEGYLGAIRMAHDSKAQATLTPTPAFVDTNLYWAGNQVVTYHASVSANGTRTAFFAELGPTGFEPQGSTNEPLAAGVVMQVTDNGFFMIAPGDYPTEFYELSDPRTPTEHLDIALVSPSGRYSAALDSDDKLSVLSAEQGSLAPFAVAADACPMPLAWAKDVERIACLADVANPGTSSTHGEIRIFDVDAESHELEMSTLADFCDDDVTTLNGASCANQPDRYAYATVLASGAARAFSRSGRWLAFTAVHDGRAFLYTADLALRPFGLTSSTYFERLSASLRTQMAFSPDERQLLFQLGPSLTLHTVNGKTVIPAASDALTASQDCTEDFTSAPHAYCGNTDQQAFLPWSPDSKAFAFRTPGTVVVASLLPGSLGTTTFPSAVCDGECSDRFAFQPQPASTIQP